MVFFDLNVPYLVSDDAAAKENAIRKAARLKVVVKAMELGYSGVAYDRAIKGVMSDKDSCTIAPFPLSSLLKALPVLSASVSFHRGLLGVPLSEPFRQYRRLTVAAETVAQVAALNSGNPVLRTYDLVAVRPLSQPAFEQSCRVANVDLISINFCQKLPFRLKLPMVKAAIERGIYFEITYSHFISDVQSRKKLISGAEMLVEWTRGKNLIVCSAATSADELRGPYDVANLSTLLGLSTEHAKNAVSKNCRILLDKAFKKKQFYKETLKMEKLSSTEQSSSKQELFRNWSNWDPISSGDGDLPPLEDFVKQFSDVIEVQKNPFHDLNINISNNESNPYLDENASEDPTSCKYESMTPLDDIVTVTHGMQSCSTGTKAPAVDHADHSFSNIDESGVNNTTLSRDTILQGAAYNVEKFARSSELDSSSIPALNQTCNLSEAGISNSSELSHSDNDSSAQIPSMLIASSNMVNDIPVSIMFTRNESELEPPTDLEMSFDSPVKTNNFSGYGIENKVLAFKGIDVCPMIKTSMEIAVAPVDKNKSILDSSGDVLYEHDLNGGSYEEHGNSRFETYNGSLFAGSELPIVSEKELQVTDAMLVGGGFGELQTFDGVSALRVISAPLDENCSMEQGHKLPSVNEARPCKQSPGRGRGRFVRKLRQKALNIPTSGLFKPLLFKRKTHRTEGSKKHSLNHAVQY